MSYQRKYYTLMVIHNNYIQYLQCIVHIANHYHYRPIQRLVGTQTWKGPTEVISYDIDFSRSIPSHLPPTPSSLEHQALTRPPLPIPSSSSHPSRSPTAAGNCARSGKWGFYSCDNYFIGFSAGFRHWCTREQLLLNRRSRTGRSLHMMLIFQEVSPHIFHPHHQA